MTDDTRVLYNETCPVCRFEIDAYAKRVRADGLPVKFEDLSRAAEWGLTRDQAAQRLHVIHKGALLSGMPAFRALWSALAFRGLADRPADHPPGLRLCL